MIIVSWVWLMNVFLFGMCAGAGLSLLAGKAGIAKARRERALEKEQ